MNRVALAFGFAGLLVSSLTVAADGYLCVTDMTTGFSFDSASKRWNTTTFKATAQFVVRRPNADDKALYEKAATAKWVVKETGYPIPTAFCAEDFNIAGYLSCGDGLQSFRMNKNDLRFLIAYTVGYVGRAKADEGGDTPNIAIGKCSPI